MPPTFDAWSSPPANWGIGPGQLHLWRSPLQTPPPDHWQWLSPDEGERAQRYRLPRDRDRFAAGRLLLRRILARYLGIEPGEVLFRYSLHGRPALDPGCLRGSDLIDLDFNLAHSEDRALIAVGRGVRVGVDLERIDPAKVDEGMLGLVCSASELRWLADLPWQEQVQSFYRCWTRKEAYLKARGEGLILPMSDFSLLPIDGDATVAASPMLGSDLCADWQLVDLAAWPGFAASLAAAVTAEGAISVGRQSLRLCDWR